MAVDSDFRIIVIDDNPAIHIDFIKILSTSATSDFEALSKKMFGSEHESFSLPKFQIDTASQGQEGVESIKKSLSEGKPYSLAFVDIRMPPGWDGIETIKRIWQLDKDIQIVICTAYSDYSWEETISHLGKTDNLLILKKPFDNVSVRQLACALTRKWQLLQDTRKFTLSLKKQVDHKTVSLQKSLSLVKATLESSDEGIVVVNQENKIIDFNSKFVSMWDIPSDILETRDLNTLFTFMHDQLIDSNEFHNSLKNMHDSEDIVRIDSIKFKNGQIFDCYSQPQKVNSEIVGRVLNFRDITQRSKFEKELQFQATHDTLTGLPNRVLLFEKMREAIKESERNNTRFAIMFLDLDRFKLINDSLSHASGDELLKTASDRLQSATRSEDTLARLGGDEFVILLTNIHSEEDVTNKAKQIMKLFHKPFKISNRNVTTTVSIGICIYPNDGTTVDILLRNADAAMYHAKEVGSDTFQLYSQEMNLESLTKLDQEMELREAIDNNEFFLCYQPQFNIADQELIAVEALLRWNHPQKGILLPVDFIPLAEQTGLIVPMGEWVIRTACLQCKAWQDAGLPPVRIAVNISMQQLKQQNIVEIIKNILLETKLDPHYLELELTENIIINSLEVIRVVTELKKLDVGIAVDDFGTGYSSLSYLKNLPLDRLKIDGSFIQHINSEKDDEVIIRAIIAVAKNLNLEVIAEGVETQNQLNYLKNQKCDEIQGYYFSSPLSSTELEALLKKTRKKDKVL